MPKPRNGNCHAITSIVLKYRPREDPRISTSTYYVNTCKLLWSIIVLVVPTKSVLNGITFAEEEQRGNIRTRLCRCFLPVGDKQHFFNVLYSA